MRNNATRHQKITEELIVKIQIIFLVLCQYDALNYQKIKEI